MDGRDVLGIAQTGTGKTAAFGLPILECLLAERRPGPRALVLAPTRELAVQIRAEIESFAKFTPVKCVSIFGGVPQGAQVRALRADPEIVIACPGRLLDLMEQRLVRLMGIETLVIDEADHMFDLGFLNAELKRCSKPPIFAERATDTLAIARTRFPGAKHSLDALCQRYDIDRSMRVHHGALLDAQLLAQVYVELTGGRQIGFDLMEEAVATAVAAAAREYREPRPHAATPEELARHVAFIAKLKDPVWLSA